MTPETINALVNLGSAGAVIVVVGIFLKSIKERDAEWRDFFTAISSSNKSDIQEMRGTAAHLLKLLEDLVKSYNDHDDQAKEIMRLIGEVRAELARISPRRPQ